MLSRLKKVNFLIGKAGRIKFLVLLAFMIINSLLEMVGIGTIPIFIVIISNPDMIMQHNRTIITIAHRLTTVRNCDVIYLINEGCILEHGGYDYLLKSSSAFRKMNLVEI